MNEKLELFSGGEEKEGGYSAGLDFKYEKKDGMRVDVSFGSACSYGKNHKVCIIYLGYYDGVEIKYIAYNDHDDYERVKTIIKHKERSDEVKYGQIKKMVLKQISVQNKFDALISLVRKNGIAEGREQKRKELANVLESA